MADPVIVVSPAPVTTGQTVTLTTTDFDKKLSATDNLVQELADAFDEHVHAASEVTVGTYTGIIAGAANLGAALTTLDGHSHGLSDLSDFVAPNDNLTDLGAADARWKDIYAGNAVIQTSDRNFKTDIKDIDNPWAFIESLRPRQFRFKGGKRLHTGFIAQDVRDSLEDNLGADYAIYCESNGVCGLRYEEAIAPAIAAIMDLDIRTMDTKCKLESLTAEVHALVEEANKPKIPIPDIVQDSVSIAEHRTIVDNLVSRISALEAKEEFKPSHWPAWLAIGVSVIVGLLHFI